MHWAIVISSWFRLRVGCGVGLRWIEKFPSDFIASTNNGARWFQESRNILLASWYWIAITDSRASLYSLVSIWPAAAPCPHLVFCTRLVNCLLELSPPESHSTCDSKHNLYVIFTDPVYSVQTSLILTKPHKVQRREINLLRIVKKKWRPLNESGLDLFFYSHTGAQCPRNQLLRVDER